MLFTLGLLLLLTPFPSFQTTTNEKRNVTGSDMIKPKTVSTLSTPKTTVVLAKQAVSLSLKPNTVLQGLATNQKPPTVNSTVTIKSKPSPTGRYTTPTASVKPTSPAVSNRDKLSVNQTDLTKHPPANEVKDKKDKPAPTAAPNVESTSTMSTSASGAKTKDKTQPSLNQMVLMKSLSRVKGKTVKDMPTTSKSPNVQATSPKTASTSNAKTKDKTQPSVNQTVSIKSPSSKDGKDKSTPNEAPNTQLASTMSAAINNVKTTKDILQPSVNQTVSIKSPLNKEGKDKPTSPDTSTIQPASAKSTSANSTKTSKGNIQTSVNQTVSTKSHSSNERMTVKDQPAPTVVPSVQTTSSKPASASSVKTTKDKLQPSVNQTVLTKSPSAPTIIQNVQSTSPKSASGAKPTKSKHTASISETVLVKPPSSSDVKKAKDKPALSVTQTGVSTPIKAASSNSTAADKDKATASGNQTSATKSPTTTASAKATKEKPQQPINVVISEGCDSSQTKEQELKLKPGSPLVMTHKISLLPGGCGGDCEAEMAALKDRVTRLEREMSSMKEKCPCSVSCPNECSGNGQCEKGKCVCHQGFVGPDCSKCAHGVECNKKAAKGKVKVTVETVSLQVKKHSSAIKDSTQAKVTKVEQTLFQKKDQKKVTESKDVDTKPKEATNTRTNLLKILTNQETSAKKVTRKGSSSKTKSSKPTVGQVMLKHDRRKQEELRKAKTIVSKKVLSKTDLKLDITVKDGPTGKIFPKSEQLRDQPQSNVSLSKVRKSEGTSKIGTILSKAEVANKTRTEAGAMEQSTLVEKNFTQLSGHKHIKKVKVDNINVTKTTQSDALKAGKGKITQKSQYIINATVAASSDEARALQNKTAGPVSGVTTRRMGTSGLGSVKVVNISSYSFTVTWLAPQGMFKSFTVIRREPATEGDEDHEEFEEEALDGTIASSIKNTTEVQLQGEGTNVTISSAKSVESRGRAESKRISMVVPGNVRSVEFSNLRSHTRYVLYIYGTASARRSKIHRVTATTGPEPATEMIFSNVTESSISVSWSKPKTTFTGFMVTYTHSATGETGSVTVDSEQSYVVLSKLSSGSSYIISVVTTHGRSQSDVLTSTITTVPAPPTQLQVINATDTRAVVQWTPSLGKVDRFIITYESSKTPNVTVTVMLHGNSVEHQLRGLQRGTLYTVKVMSQKDSLQSTAIQTTFSTAYVVKAREVSSRSAVITWRTSTVVYHSYRLIYWVAGGETKEVIVDTTVTEYTLTGLLPMSAYNVLVEGEKDGRYTSIVTTEFITGKVRFPYPTECSQELLNGALQSGEVDIYPQGKEGPSVRVYCDMETDGGGWTVLQRRMNGKTDFYRTWSDYSTGFGNLSEEFWLGNELLHNLTSAGPVSLRVDMQDGNDTAYAHYANFSVESEDRHYALMVSGYTGTAGDSMRYHNGRPFSTRDKDPDPLGIHCSRAYMGGWWYKNCYKTNLNGLYGTNSDNLGVVWIDWKGKDSSIPFTEMKFRPSRFSPATHG
ncbi:uncharacterized protein tnxba [Thalassophryne amazonica]|uniref:uncharacterized protein tnxba n=1 Tax=Thalassophryne amazonica TaxID=390379 RepID=UPI00147113CF|nr:uncharacterized protein tnxba [Thalassophryne amazonica]